MILIKQLVSFFLYHTGILTLLLKWDTKKYGLVIYGHKVSADNIGFFNGVDPHHFEKALRFLKRSFDFITMDELTDYLASKRSLNRKSIVISLDDGFRDNYVNAFPVLKKMNIPAIIYLVHDCIERGHLPWSQRLAYSFQVTKCKRLEWMGGDICIDSTNSRIAAYKKIKSEISSYTENRREECLQKIEEQLSVKPTMDQMLTWDMVNEMKSSNIQFGAHTLTHPMLNKLSHEEAVFEIRQCKTKIEERIGSKMDHFVFPAGSYNDSLLEEIPKAGYVTCSVRPQINDFRILQNTSPFRIVRLGIPNAPYYVLIAEVSGVFSFFRRLFKKK